MLVFERTGYDSWKTSKMVEHSAGLGWTLAQFEQQYGKPVINQEQIGGRIGYAFRGKDYIIAAFFLNTRVSRIMYICGSGSVFSWGTARALLSANAVEGIWGDPFKSDTDDSYRVNGTKMAWRFITPL
jgi:hypothetical protein